nr:hypothetical protein [uncultured Chryseobacterium sp.]
MQITHELNRDSLGLDSSGKTNCVMRVECVLWILKVNYRFLFNNSESFSVIDFIESSISEGISTANFY